jgi:20S proteasome alpha/beta subunit
MKYILFFVSYLLLNLFSNAQDCIRGSYSIAAFSKDGIVIVADTRSSFFNPRTNEQLAFYDTSQKIFVVHDYAMSITGPATIQGKFVEYYINEYNKQPYIPRLSMDSTINDFAIFMYNNFPQVAKDFFTVVRIFIGRFYTRVGYIGLAESANFKASDGTGYVSTDTLVQYFNKHYSAKNSCKKNARLAIKAIKKHIKAYNKKAAIGGPMMVLKISPNNSIQWLKNKKNTPSPMDLREFADQYKSDKLNIHFLSEEKELLFNEIINSF